MDVMETTPSVRRSVIEGLPIALAPGLHVVPVVGWTAEAGSLSPEEPEAITLEPLALIVSTQAGVARLVLGNADAYPAPDAPGATGDRMTEAARQACVAAVFGPVTRDGEDHRIAVRRASGVARGAEAPEISTGEAIATLIGGARGWRVVAP